MAYATIEYYKNTYKGTVSDDTELQKFLDWATDDIDIITDYNIVVEDLTATDLDLLKKANCSQAEWYIVNGDNVSNSADSLSIGSFSISEKSNNSTMPYMSDRAKRYLLGAGLLFRGICAI